eukprot:TRINITY_DN4476_c0_g3_i4.p1 TRINITY_DN4476_c0_g3~~TRINITY_DN4476_c0_g3_i4.p1  ORF type:complete len:254 (-),score=28.88 TRINITY_DN4476_c0_g3_i4:246-1007(-)
MIECEVHALCGLACAFVVQLDWTIATLKEMIDDEWGYQCYAQVLSDTNRILLNAEKLCDIYRRQDVIGSRFRIFLALIEVPSQLDQAQVQSAWEAFRIHSTDYGDTIPRARLAQVIQYTGMRFPDDGPVEDLRVDNETMSFVNLLSFLATRGDTPLSGPSSDLVAKVCCLSELAGARKSQCDAAVTNALRMVKQACSRGGRRRRLDLISPKQRARSSSVSSIGSRNDEMSASSLSLERSASSERTVALALMSL